MTFLDEMIRKELGKRDTIKIGSDEGTETRFKPIRYMTQISISGESIERIRSLLAQNPEIGDPSANGENFLTYTKETETGVPNECDIVQITTY